VRRGHSAGVEGHLKWDALERAYGKDAIAVRTAQAVEDAATPRRGSDVRVAARVYGMRVGLITILAATTIGIVFAPLGMEWIAKVSRHWVLLGNVGQAYGGVSALISAIALVGVVGSLLLQAHQHSLDKITSIRGRQAQIYAIVREDPKLYWPILGGVSDNGPHIRRWTFSIELLAYFSAGYETGLYSEQVLRGDIFSSFFYYEENRQFWAMAVRYWLDPSSTRRRRRFVRIANEELARARATGPGLAIPPYRSDDSRRLRLDRGLRWHMPAFAGATAVGLALLFSRRRSHSAGPNCCRD